MPKFAAVLVAVAATAAVAGCSSSYQIEAPEEPVAFTASFEIQQQISVIIPSGAPKGFAYAG